MLLCGVDVDVGHSTKDCASSPHTFLVVERKHLNKNCDPVMTLLG